MIRILRKWRFVIRILQSVEPVIIIIVMLMTVTRMNSVHIMSVFGKGGIMAEKLIAVIVSMKLPRSCIVIPSTAFVLGNGVSQK
jgi:hypothetical protein